MGAYSLFCDRSMYCFLIHSGELSLSPPSFLYLVSWFSCHTNCRDGHVHHGLLISTLQHHHSPLTSPTSSLSSKVSFSHSTTRSSTFCFVNPPTSPKTPIQYQNPFQRGKSSSPNSSRFRSQSRGGCLQTQIL